jgi:purine-binding chemotaxis protein CheW
MAPSAASPDLQLLLVRARDRTCALRLCDVVETMRPLPIVGATAAPPGVLGVAVVRGEPVPVVDLAVALDIAGEPAPTRFVATRTGARVVCLRVEAVLGVRGASPALFRELPPLLTTTSSAAVAYASLDEELVLLLRAGRLVPADTWRSLESPPKPRAA